MKKRFAGLGDIPHIPSVVDPAAPWQPPADGLSETTIESEPVFRGNFLQINRDVARLPDGKTSTREYVLHPGASAMIAVADDERILVERQFRYAASSIRARRRSRRPDANCSRKPATKRGAGPS